jgi:hypothetical protein
MAQHDRASKAYAVGMSMMNQTAKSYFDAGSIRNTAHDEEFFHCFCQYLDEAIKKMKDQLAEEGGGEDDYDPETRDFDDEMVD